MFKKLIMGTIVLVFAASCLANRPDLSQPILDLNQDQQTIMSEVIPELKKNRIILVGEHHSKTAHHMAQLTVIQALYQSGANVAIGLEMFRHDSQNALDDWVAGEMAENEFERIYYDNWNFPYSAYRPIFEYAKEKKIPLVGLNLPRKITRQVSRRGFQSLSKEEKGKLSEVACRVDEAYMKYIRKAFGGHAHGNLNFTYFCEAQLVWDNAMAINTLDYLSTKPDAVVVVLTGTGHAQKAAIPRQIRSRSPMPYVVILPEVPGMLDAHTIGKEDADYLMLDL
ncbi:MAG: ChaN family lipoprotein [Desulfobacterales bacterium]|jgi:uncharacterized iron-regulated protein